MQTYVPIVGTHTRKKGIIGNLYDTFSTAVIYPFEYRVDQHGVCAVPIMCGKSNDGRTSGPLKLVVVANNTRRGTVVICETYMSRIDKR